MFKEKLKHDIQFIGWCMHGLGLFLLCAVLLLIVIFVNRPLDEQKKRNQHQAKRVIKFIQTSKNVNSQHEELTTQLKQQQADWKQILSQMPATPEESDYLAKLTTLVEKSNLLMSNFNPGTSHDYENLKERDISLLLTGTYSNLCQFLDDMSRMPRITNIQHLKIDAPNQNHDDGIYQINLKIKMAYAFQDTSPIN